ncbi:MAG TPA: hypothetical protein VK786_06940 [bacterium]|nr:hypothetical protein [bacterium]
MIQLNLLPPKVRAAELLRKILLGAGLAYALVFGWVAWQWSVKHVQLVMEQHEVDRVQAQLNSPELQVAVAAVQKFADDMASVKAKASVVDQYREEQVPLMKLMDAIPDWTMGGQVWFTHLDAEEFGPAHTRSVVLGGATLSRALFAQFYEFIGDQPEVQRLSLANPPAIATVRNTQTVQFRLNFTGADVPAADQP